MFAISKSHWSESISENDGFTLEWRAVSGGQVVLAGNGVIRKSATGWQ